MDYFPHIAGNPKNISDDFLIIQANGKEGKNCHVNLAMSCSSQGGCRIHCAYFLDFAMKLSI